MGCIGDFQKAESKKDSLETLGDDELMQLVREENEPAFELLVRRHQQQALRIAQSFLGSRSEAEDVVQNAFLEIYRHRDRYEPRGCFSAFLYRVVLNEACQALRKHRRFLSAIEKLTTMRKSLPEEKVADPALRRALDKLSVPQRQVLALRFGGGLQLGEIAEILRQPQGTIKSRLFYGLRRLRSLLEGDGRS